MKRYKKCSKRCRSAEIVALMTVILLLTALRFPAVEVKADTGPKPSVVVNVEGLQGEECYGTLLSESASTGPYSVYGSSGWGAFEEGDEDYDIWMKFVNYEDSDGYYFLQLMQRCHETGKISWTYYPPQKFKILLYFPERDAFVVSEVVERYAFDSYFTVELDEGKITDLNWIAPVKKSYDYSAEIKGLIARVIITILVECLIMFIMGFRKKHHIKVIIPVNIATQLALNVLLNINSFYNGDKNFVLYYIMLEILVFAIEAVAYCMLIGKLSKETDTETIKKPVVEKKSYIVLYALIANVASLLVGVWVADLFTGIF